MKKKIIVEITYNLEKNEIPCEAINIKIAMENLYGKKHNFNVKEILTKG